MTLKIIGSSIRKEFVICSRCKKEFSWLNAKICSLYDDEIKYVAICAACRKKDSKTKKFNSIKEVKDFYFPKESKKEIIQKQRSEDTFDMTPVYPGGPEAFWP